MPVHETCKSSMVTLTPTRAPITFSTEALDFSICGQTTNLTVRWPSKNNAARVVANMKARLCQFLPKF